MTVCYDGTVRNSLGDLIQLVYGEDGMDGPFIENQNIQHDGHVQAVEHSYRVDVTDPACRLASMTTLPVNVSRIAQNALQIFCIDRRKPSDLDPSYIVDSVI
jgi:DNA-directed RNA polymerase II subunit RPB1